MMTISSFLRYDLNVYSFILLCFILTSLCIKKDKHNFTNKIFKLIIIVNLVMLVLEILSWQFDRLDGKNNWYLNYMFNFIFIMLEPLISALWASYIDYKIFGSKERLRRRKYYIYPFLISVILVTVNFFCPILFTISSDNIYSREPLLWLNLVSVGLLLVYIFSLAAKNRHKFNGNITIGILMFFLLPIIGAVIQMLYFGVLLTWPMMAMSIVVSYLIIETVNSSRDYLTNLYNRFKADEYIKYFIEKDKEFAVIMIDLDNFKQINDEFGHKEGDETLIIFSKILRNFFDSKSMISRFGGDEFVIVVEYTNSSDIEEYLEKIKKYITHKHQSGEISRVINFSYGYSKYYKGNNVSYNDLLIKADKEMYFNKSMNRNLKRRKSDRLFR